ncbi:hypothetical protein I3843_03G077600 [Carya illinoinensis]|uniref:AUGMIN subunit 5 n=1 Tax=Carya illinoinensis TaxID=32201 RepID=A0A922FIA4_CARIL|nr:hypothetical protein I3760_03G075000 [Carya illinoinensis]KAG6720776.1 hypothetical protein I3842_03G077700 [Carya illinoinensis]KAG7986411.1 hypothetical protein I3843_03G077600 [Carya illinoinensis]
MQSSLSSAAQPEAILEWLHKEMGYRPLGPYSASSGKSQLPSIESLRKISRGNMIPVWNFLITRVKSDKTVENIRRNITVHGGGNSSASDSGSGGVKEEGRSRGRRKEKVAVEEGLGVAETREAALQERESSAKEVERLRNILRRQRRDLRAKMLEVSREEAERKRMLDERANYRHKEVMLNAYEQQCDEAAKIFAEYHKRLHYYVNQARDAQGLNVDSSDEVVNSFSANSEKEAVYSTVKGSKSADDMILIETNRERSIRKACESLAAHMIEKIRNSFPAYEGSGIHLNPQLEAAKLGFDFDGEIPDEVRTVIASCLKSPPQLLQAITAYTLRLKTLISREIEKIDVRADAETLRYKYENNTVMDVSSPDVNSALHYQLYGNGKIGGDIPSRGTQNQLLERQKAHVQQFLATEDALNKAAESSDLIQKLVKRLHGSSDVVSSHPLGVGGAAQNMSSLRQFEFEVWAKEREAAGLRASLNTLMAEVQRLNTLCAERREAEDSLKKKWKKIEEFDARRSELETIYTALLKANMALLESMGANGSTGPEAVAAAEKNAAILTAKAGARDLSAIPSICRVSAALQYPAGLEGSDASLASVLESLEFCLKLRGSEASVLEDLAKAINLVHIRQELVESGHALLNHSYRAQQEYERTTSYCLNLAAEQEKSVMEKWLPELKTAVLNAQKSFEDCKYVRGLLDEWWEQPASTVVDWVTVDGQNVAAWHNHVKQQLLAFYDKELL